MARSERLSWQECHKATWPLLTRGECAAHGNDAFLSVSSLRENKVLWAARVGSSRLEHATLARERFTTSARGEPLGYILRRKGH